TSLTATLMIDAAASAGVRTISVSTAAGTSGTVPFTVTSSSPLTLTGFNEYPLPTGGHEPIELTVGPDGNLWFTERSGNHIGRITPAGVITEFTVPTVGVSPWGITTGPDGNMWFTESTGS